MPIEARVCLPQASTPPSEELPHRPNPCPYWDRTHRRQIEVYRPRSRSSPLESTPNNLDPCSSARD
uniref:Uncharacterized protein n=1 Tax=Arundo donax TaxID=35708 RepID=A0A0A8Z2X7_ARUDO